MDQNDTGKQAGQKGEGVVLVLADYRGRRRKPPKCGAQALQAQFQAALDDATRDLHAAASMTMKMVFLARDRMGLPPL